MKSPKFLFLWHFIYVQKLTKKLTKMRDDMSVGFLPTCINYNDDKYVE